MSKRESLHQKKLPKQTSFAIKGDEIERWRNEFLKIRDEESMYVDYDLANDKLDRIEVYQSKEYMAHVASLVQTRMDERTTPKPISIWKEAKELTEIERQKTTQDLQTEREKSLEEHKMEATKFYRELLIFVEAKKLTKNDNVVELVCYIKNLLENGLPANRNIFFECFRFTGHNSLECNERAKVFKFLRHYFQLKQGTVRNFTFKMGWHILCSKMDDMFKDCIYLMNYISKMDDVF